ncbi:MAG: hypothetical protein J0L57_01480 [Burkholderiales bacterium]|nr:hypothetical protein [Burkholderiales bacterium]
MQPGEDAGQDHHDRVVAFRIRQWPAPLCDRVQMRNPLLHLDVEVPFEADSLASGCKRAAGASAGTADAMRQELAMNCMPGQGPPVRAAKCAERLGLLTTLERQIEAIEDSRPTSH